MAQQPESEMSTFYPLTPFGVPADITRAPLSYRIRLWVAVLALVAFLGGYLALCAWFVFSAYQSFFILFGHGRMNTLRAAAFGFVALILAVLLLKALFRRTRVVPSGLLEVDASEEPELFRFLYRLADDAGAPRPHRVYVSARVNAGVFYDSSLVNLFLPAKKSLEVGLGLVNVLNLSEFKAVLAHEFGHFAQRSMAVGRWVYVAQGVVAEVVRGRDRFDEFILSQDRIRIPILGPLFRLSLWSLRSVLETAFIPVVLLERALSREMEFQADRVAVALTGSDPLIHALHRLEPADLALEEATRIASVVACARGVQLPDLFEVQELVLEESRRVLEDPHYASVPDIPESRRAAHRIFQKEMANPLQMWASHPANSEREQNAKGRYVESALDARSAWVLFQDPAGLRRELSDYVYERSPGSEDLVFGTSRDARKAVRQRFDRRVFEPRYRGVYLERSPVLRAADAASLFGERPEAPPQRAAVLNELTRLYPSRLRQADEAEKAAHDDACRRAHLAAARSLGLDWEKYLQRLIRLLHYATHTSADLSDAYDCWRSEVAVALASRRVTKRAQLRLARAGAELHAVLERVHSQRRKVKIPAAVADRLGVVHWDELLRERFDLKPPAEDAALEWFRLGESWFREYSAVVGALRDDALEALLDAEDWVAENFRKGIRLSAPSPASVPKRYVTRVPGSERERSERLPVWDRFLLGKGLVPGTLRFGVAGSILACVAGFSGMGASSDVVVLNGLGCPVSVDIGDRQVTLEPGRSERVRVTALQSLRIDAKAYGETIDSDTFHIEQPGGVYVYNVAGAASLMESTVSYGSAHATKPSRLLGAPRWYVSKAEYTLEKPPETLSVGSGGVQRQVIEALDSTSARLLLSTAEADEQQRMIEAHATWDAAESVSLREWLTLAASRLSNAEEIFERRRARDPLEVETLRIQQDVARARGTLQETCKKQVRLAELHPENSGLAYLRARCVEDEAEQAKAFDVALTRFPNDPWLMNAVAWNQLDRGEYTQAMATLESLRRGAPRLQDESVLLIARLRRVTDSSLGMAVLKAESTSLEQMLLIERGGRLADLNRGFYHLARGEFRDAVAQVETDPVGLPRVLRLVGASQGAPEDLVARAAALEPEEGMNGDTLFPALALAARFRMDRTPYIKFAEELQGKDSAMLLALLDNDAETLKDTARMEKVLKDLPMQARASAYVLACSYLGERAPLAWRKFVMNWYFAPERPYFSVE